MDLQFLSKTVLFRGSTPDNVQSMLHCLGAYSKSFGKGEVIFQAGTCTQVMGLVLTGNVSIENDDVWGNKSLLDSVGPGQVFAETYACLPNEPLMVSAVAVEPSEILFLEAARLLRTCPDACAHHQRLISSLLGIAAQKNLRLSRRIFHTSAKSIRGRLLSYLSFEASRQGSYEFSIPFDRQQLADYLSVDRSALSNELGKMQRDGLLTVKKNHFYLRPGAEKGL